MADRHSIKKRTITIAHLILYPLPWGLIHLKHASNPNWGRTREKNCEKFFKLRYTPDTNVAHCLVMQVTPTCPTVL